MKVSREVFKPFGIRIVLGQLAFLLYYAALSMAPLTLLVVCAKLDSFFVLILAYLINREEIVPLELLGILICFGSVIVITLS